MDESRVMSESRGHEAEGEEETLKQTPLAPLLPIISSFSLLSTPHTL